MSDHKQQGRLGGVSARSVAIGIILVILVNIWIPYSEYMLGSSRINLSHLPVASFFCFILLIILNAFIGLVYPKSVLRPSELVVIFIMVFVGAILPGGNLIDFVLGIISTPHYFASPENRWGEYLLPHIPDWIVVSDKGEVLRWVFEGLPRGEDIPWSIWFIPLFWWFSLIGAVAFVSICIVSILRKQWVENERLAFPLAELPIELLKEPGGGFRLPATLRHRNFWIGFSIPLFMILWNIVGYFSLVFPKIPINEYNWTLLLRDFPEIAMKLNFYVIGFAFLVSQNILFSVWFFCLLAFLQVGISNRFGYSIGPAGDCFGSWDAATSWQSFGALIFMVLWGLWMARGHLRDVVKKAFNSNHPVDDSGELLSYRTALFGLFIGGFYIACWLHKSGMDYASLALYLFGAFISQLGAARLLAETGLLYLRAPLSPHLFAIYSLGSAWISRASMAALSFTNALLYQGKGVFMPAFAHVAKLGKGLASGDVGRGGRKVATATAVAFAIAIAAGFWYMIWEGYNTGANNFHVWPFPKHGSIAYEFTVGKMRNPFGTDWNRLAFLGIGGAVMAILTLARYKLLWWPLHPIGLTIGATWMVYTNVLSIFVAWVCKFLILRLGGGETYKSAKPFFLGLPVGHAVGVAISFLVDMIWFPGQGHVIHEW